MVDKETRKLFIVLAILTGPVAGVIFAFKNYGETNPVCSFLGGLVTGPLFLVFTYGFILSGAYTGGALDKRFNKPKPRETYGGGFYPPNQFKEGLSMAGGFAITACWMVPLYWMAMELPVIGSQLGFMFRD
ncbi:hypothetical protein [Mesorhizobium sp. URHB0026]